MQQGLSWSPNGLSLGLGLGLLAVTGALCWLAWRRAGYRRAAGLLELLRRRGRVAPVDTRIIGEVLDGTGRIIDSQDEVGGWPELARGSAPASDAATAGAASATCHGCLLCSLQEPRGQPWR